MFILGDAGMGKTSFLVMIRLFYLLEFLPSKYRCELLKLGPDTVTKISGIKNGAHTLLLLDSLDEDPSVADNTSHSVSDRIEEILTVTSRFLAVIITCRTQYFPTSITASQEILGSIRVKGYRCPLLYLTPFRDDQVEAYLRKRFPPSIWQKMRRQKSPEHLVAHKILQRTMTLRFRPMLLAYIDDLVKELSEREIGAFDAFDLLVKEWLAREERRPKIGEIDKIDSKEALYAACVAVAWRLDELNMRFLSPDELAELLAQKSYVRNIKRIDIGGRALLNKTSSGAFRFAHFSLQEFLLAKEILRMANAQTDHTPADAPPLSVHGTSELLRFISEGARRKEPLRNITFRECTVPRILLEKACFYKCIFERASFALATLAGCSFKKKPPSQRDVLRCEV